MIKINNSIIILLLLLSTQVLFSQLPSVSADSTSANSSFENRTKFNLNPFIISNKLSLGQKDYFLPDKNVSDFRIDLYSREIKSLFELKTEIQNYMNMRRNMMPNYDLGEFGKYLGYANTLAVILLAISHISKYGFK